MSNQLAIAAVTAVLRNLLNSRLGDLDQTVLGSVKVTALPPDRITSENGNEVSQLNLFMYHAAPNAGWANVGLASRDAAGQRLTNPPLALDLHYLLMAYGAEQFHADTLLGYGMQMLHENPVLARGFISQTLNPGGNPPNDIAMLANSGLADQVELVKICPQPMNTEELSKLWTAFQSHLRPTAAYRLSVVLLERDGATRSALPVLTRGKEDRGPGAFAEMLSPYPAIERLVIPNGRIAALIGDTLTVEGRNLSRIFELDGPTGPTEPVTVQAEFEHPRRNVPPIEIAAGERSDTQARFVLANGAAYPAGVYAIRLVVTPTATPSKAQSTNDVALMIAPRVTSVLPMTVIRTNVDVITGLGDATINLSCAPEVLPGQRALLVLGNREVIAEPFTAQASMLTFKVTKMAAGEYRLRLRVDGVESTLIDRSATGKPKFDETQKVVLT